MLRRDLSQTLPTEWSLAMSLLHDFLEAFCVDTGWCFVVALIRSNLLAWSVAEVL